MPVATFNSPIYPFIFMSNPPGAPGSWTQYTAVFSMYASDACHLAIKSIADANNLTPIAVWHGGLTPGGGQYKILLGFNPVNFPSNVPPYTEFNDITAYVAGYPTLNYVVQASINLGVTPANVPYMGLAASQQNRMASSLVDGVLDAVQSTVSTIASATGNLVADASAAVFDFMGLPADRWREKFRDAIANNPLVTAGDVTPRSAVNWGNGFLLMPGETLPVTVTGLSTGGVPPANSRGRQGEIIDPIGAPGQYLGKFKQGILPAGLLNSLISAGLGMVSSILSNLGYTGAVPGSVLTALAPLFGDVVRKAVEAIVDEGLERIIDELAGPDPCCESIVQALNALDLNVSNYELNQWEITEF